MRRAARVDDNQPQIVKLLRRCPGISVKIVSQLKKFCDLVIGYDGKSYLIELKDPEKPPSARKLTPDEQAFKDSWTGHYAVCMTLEEILKEIGYN